MVGETRARFPQWAASRGGALVLALCCRYSSMRKSVWECECSRWNRPTAGSISSSRSGARLFGRVGVSRFPFLLDGLHLDRFHVCNGLVPLFEKPFLENAPVCLGGGFLLSVNTATAYTMEKSPTYALLCHGEGRKRQCP